VGTYGQHVVAVETSDGKIRLLPCAWTNLRPRAEGLALGERAVLLAPVRLRGLASWVAARRAGGEEVADRAATDDKGEDGERSPGGPGSTTSVVGEARSAGRGRRVEKPERGTR